MASIETIYILGIGVAAALGTILAIVNWFGSPSELASSRKEPGLQMLRASLALYAVCIIAGCVTAKAPNIENISLAFKSALSTRR